MPLPLGERLALSDGEIEYVDLPAAAGHEQRPAVVLLHEALGSVGLWRNLPAVLARRTRRRVVAYSRHGHGRSDPMTGPRGTDFLHVEAQQVLPEVQERLGLRRPVLIGHSDGACIALIHAGTRNLDDPAAIALLAPHVIVEPVAFAGVEAAQIAYRDGDLAQRLARHHDHPDELFRAWSELWTTPEFADWSLSDLIPEVRSRVLLMQGVDDEYGSMQQLDLTERLLSPTVPVQRIDLGNCGHQPHLERPDIVTDALVDLVAAT